MTILKVLSDSKIDVMKIYRMILFKTIITSLISMCFILIIGYGIINVLCPNEDIQYRISSITYLVAIVTCIDYIHCCLQGVLEGFSLYVDGNIISILGRWITGITTAYYLCYETRPRFDLYGFWIGLGIGEILSVALLIFRIFNVNVEIMRGNFNQK